MYRRRSNYRFKRNRRFGKRKLSVRRRIIRRTLRRRPLRPEIKYINVENVQTTIGYAGRLTLALSPSTIDVGTGASQRIGQEIMARKLLLRFFLKNNAGNTGATAPVTAGGVTRLILWTPRVDFDAALLHMNTMGLMTQPDWNTVTIHKDFLMYNSPPYLDLEVANASGVLGAGGSGKQEQIKSFAMPFPRKMKFRPQNSQVDPNKDVLYCTWCNGEQPVAIATSCKLTYTDA